MRTRLPVQSVFPKQTGRLRRREKFPVARPWRPCAIPLTARAAPDCIGRSYRSESRRTIGQSWPVNRIKPKFNKRTDAHRQRLPKVTRIPLRARFPNVAHENHGRGFEFHKCFRTPMISNLFLAFADGFQINVGWLVGIAGKQFAVRDGKLHDINYRSAAVAL
jgi:hypothetical protein